MLIVARMNKQNFHLHRSLRVHTTESGVLNGGLPASSDRAQLQSKASLSSFSLSLSLSHTQTHVHPPASLTVPSTCMHTSNFYACYKFQFAVVQNIDLFSSGYCMPLIPAPRPSHARIQNISAVPSLSFVSFKSATLQASWPGPVA